MHPRSRAQMSGKYEEQRLLRPEPRWKWPTLLPGDNAHNPQQVRRLATPKSEAQQSVPHRHFWNVHECNLFAERLRELGRHLGMRQRFGTSDVVGLSLVAAFGERGNSHGCDIAHVNDAHSRVANGREETSVRNDRGTEP